MDLLHQLEGSRVEKKEDYSKRKTYLGGRAKLTKTDEDSSVWKGLGQKKRKILPRDRIQSKIKICSMWKGQRQ